MIGNLIDWWGSPIKLQQMKTFVRGSKFTISDNKLKNKQERIMFHRAEHFTLRLFLEGLGRFIIRDKSTKVSWAQETRLFDLSNDLLIYWLCLAWIA